MPISLLSDNPLFFLAWVGAILIALSTHEFAHAYASYRLGDNTAKDMGRLTLNPLAHIDWLGFFMLLLVGFGWGKPVMTNPYNLKYKKWGMAVVALAGPLANLINIIFFGVILKLIGAYLILSPDNLLIQFINLLIIINTILMIFNLFPIPPLDGSKLLFTLLDKPKYEELKARLSTQGPLILIGLILLDNIFGIGIFSAIFSGIINFVYRFF
ncbi:site-2 protease family protein [Candidatus Parcubacteria bacterium]|nr:site-2 protease family protein [Patescibacteria group bacterium]MCG2694182.1 site-2 protease family protein [Candidatus Parcubacteria bacterium]